MGAGGSEVRRLASGKVNARPHMLSRRALLSLLAAAAALGCADLKDMVSLQQGLAREFHTSAINVSLNNSAYLTVVFSNSPVADWSEAGGVVLAAPLAD